MSTKLIEELRSIEGSVEEHKVKLEDFIKNVKNVLILTYSGSGIIPSNVAYWYLKILKPSISTSMYSVDEFIYHIAPYMRNKADVLGIFSEGQENNAIRFRDVCVSLGLNHLIITPVLDSRVVTRIRSNNLLTINTSNYLLYVSLLFAKAITELAEEKEVLRVKRLLSEVRDFGSVINELYNEYKDAINGIVDAVKSIDEVMLTYTPTMLSPAYLLFYEIRARGLGISIVNATSALQVVQSLTKSNLGLIVFSTDVESHVINEVLFKARIKGCRVIDIRLKTDPLTASIYGLFLSKIIIDSLGRQS